MDLDEAKNKEGFYRTMKIDKQCPKCNHNMGFSDNDANLYEWIYCAKCDYYERWK